MNIRFVESSTLPTAFGIFTLHGFEEDSGKEHIALTMGTLSPGESILTRLHSECLTGDSLFSMRCDCGYQLQEALRAIGEAKQGVILYLRQEGRGIGLINKIRAYKLQDAGADTVDANVKLGFGADMRKYNMCQPMLTHLGVSKVRLMTNNPEKVAAMKEAGIRVVERVPLLAGANPYNESYLSTKAKRMAHYINASQD